jgi:hypothetical protein
MTLSQAYPYLVLHEVPEEDIPYIACNDMLAGDMADEIVAIAALSQADGWELVRLLPRASAHLDLPPMTQLEAAKTVVRDEMRWIASQIVEGQIDLLRGANAIYSCIVDVEILGS